MKEVTGSLWTFPADVRVIPTNGIIGDSGRAVMGKGVAKQAADRYPTLSTELGKMLKDYGNRVFSFPRMRDDHGHIDHLVTLPTKRHWREDSNLDLIEAMLMDFRTFLDPKLRYAMPRVGCGEGGLDWRTEVRPLLLSLPDNVYVVSLGPELERNAR